MFDFRLLKQLSEKSSPSGFETGIRDFIISQIKDYVDKMYVDKMGNIFVGDIYSHNSLVFEAHMDEVGFIVKGITDEGLISVDSIGGIDISFFSAKRIRFSSGTVGTVLCVPVHFKEKNEKQKFGDYLIDIGKKNKSDAEKLIKVGEYGVFDTDFSYLSESDKMVCGKALDNRIGCYILISMIKSGKFKDSSFAFTVQEETGLRGAKALFNNLDFNFGVCIDTTTAFDIPDVKTPYSVAKINYGPVISFADGSTVYDNMTVSKIINILESKKIPCQTKTYLSGGNDASAIQKTGAGHKTVSVSVPARSIHSAISTSSITDIENTQKALEIIYDLYSDGEI